MVDDRKRAPEVIERRRRGRGPLQRGRFPWIVGRKLAPESTVNKVVNKNQLHSAGADGCNRNEAMHRNERLEVVVNERLIAAHVAREAEVMEGHEDAVSTHEAQPEMNLTERVVHHPAEHFREPE